MARAIEINIPHDLGKDEARRRIAEGFGRLRQQIIGGLGGVFAVNERWEGDRLHFEGGALGQKVTGRIDVMADAMRMQLDLPEILAAMADRLTGKLKKEGHAVVGKEVTRTARTAPVAST